jgi:hypothetical protein
VTGSAAPVGSFADENDIPWVRFGKDDVGSKLELMRPHLNRHAATGCSGVAGIGAAQEFQRVWSAYERQSPTGAWQWWFTKADRRVSCYYFYLWDIDFGPAFIKVCTYFPYPAKVWLNGHEWAKRQAVKNILGAGQARNRVPTSATWKTVTVSRYGTTSTVKIAERVCPWYGTWRTDTVRVILVTDTGRTTKTSTTNGYDIAKGDLDGPAGRVAGDDLVCGGAGPGQPARTRGPRRPPVRSPRPRSTMVRRYHLYPHDEGMGIPCHGD